MFYVVGDYKGAIKERLFCFLWSHRVGKPVLLDIPLIPVEAIEFRQRNNFHIGTNVYYTNIPVKIVSAILIWAAWCAVATKHDPPKRCIALVFRYGGTRSVASALFDNPVSGLEKPAAGFLWPDTIRVCLFVNFRDFLWRFLPRLSPEKEAALCAAAWQPRVLATKSHKKTR
jgi:hypothetical protein